MRHLIFIILFFISGCGDEVTQTPPKPSSVPVNAVWSGGPDGGSWFICNKSSLLIYKCDIYWDSDGSLKASGNYILQRKIWSGERNRFAYIDPTNNHIDIKYNFFDGIHIHLLDEHILIPDGIITYPFSDGIHGKKQNYNKGEIAGSEIEY